VLAAAACVLAFTLSPAAGYSIALYLVLNVFYTVVGKHIVILDVMLLAFFYVLRVLLGAFAVGVAPSNWLILCTLNVSLFLAIGKRRAELVALEMDAANHRRVLEHYSLAFIDQMIGIVTSATLVCYILYTLDSRTVAMFETDLLILTVPFVIYGLFRYLYLLFHRGQGDSPTTTILLDKAFILNGALWAASCVAVIYGHETIETWLRFD
jgi:4-hydroxybenzoate polyprenyltransferase